MNYHVLTLFPEMILDGMNTSIIGRAMAKGLLTLEAVNIRDYSVTGNGRIDDYCSIGLSCPIVWSISRKLSVFSGVRPSMRV